MANLNDLRGPTLNDLQQSANEMFGEVPGTTDYPTAPVSLDEQIREMPNSEKLSGVERWLYKKLPGFAQSSVGKALESFSTSRWGKALGYLDVLAEGAERTFGLIAQYRDMKPGDDFRLRDAWKAGSLFYDVANMPRLKLDEF